MVNIATPPSRAPACLLLTPMLASSSRALIAGPARSGPPAWRLARPTCRSGPLPRRNRPVAKPSMQRCGLVPDNAVAIGGPEETTVTKLYAGDRVKIIATGALGIISAEHLGTSPRRFDVVLPPGPKDKKPSTVTCTEDELEPTDDE